MYNGSPWIKSISLHVNWNLWQAHIPWGSAKRHWGHRRLGETSCGIESAEAQAWKYKGALAVFLMWKLYKSFVLKTLTYTLLNLCQDIAESAFCLSKKNHNLQICPDLFSNLWIQFILWPRKWALHQNSWSRSRSNICILHLLLQTWLLLDGELSK